MARHSVNTTLDELLGKVNRIFVVPGAGQLLYLLCNLGVPNRRLCGDSLILAAASNDGLAVMRKMAEAYGNWDNVLVVNLTDETFPTMVAEFLNRADDIDEIWSCMPRKPVDRLVQHKFKSAKLVVFEDGLLQYAELEQLGALLRHPRRLARFLLRKFHYCMPFDLGFAPFHTFPVRKVSRLHLMLNDLFPLPKMYRSLPVHKSDPDIARDVIDHLADNLQIERTSETQPNTVLFLSAPQFTTGMLSWESELKIYVNVVKSMIDKGYQVQWKEHPKSPRPFTEALIDQVPKGRCQSFAGSRFWPIELLIKNNAFAAYAGLMSTALFTLQVLYGGNAYGLRHLFLPYLLEHSIRSTEHASKIVPRVEELPAISVSHETEVSK